jgi:hypothetical protein
MEAVLGFAWFCGVTSGALWGAAMEREEQQIARLFGCSMVFFYSLGVLVIASS